MWAFAPRLEPVSQVIYQGNQEAILKEGVRTLYNLGPVG